MSVSDINSYLFQKMNRRRNAGQGRGEVAAWGNQVLIKAPALGAAMLVNPARLNDSEVRTALLMMSQAITVQAKSMTAHANWKDVQQENPSTHSKADILQDLTRMNPPIYIGSKTSEHPLNNIDYVQKIW